MRMFQGRMMYPRSVGGRRHPRAGRPHPFLYAGARNRRTFAHRYFGTQPTGYGIRGGNPRYSGIAGSAGRVYQHMLAGSKRPQRAMSFRTSHQLGHYRKGLINAGRDAQKSFMAGRTRKDFGSRREYKAAQAEGRRQRGLARRGYAKNYVNPYTGTGHRRYTKTSHRDLGTNIKRNYFGGFTHNLSSGTRNLIDRRRKYLQGQSGRYQWGVKNPHLTKIRLGGYGYMSPRFHERLAAARRGGQTVNQAGGMMSGLRSWYQRAQELRRRRQTDQNQQDIRRGEGRVNIA